MVFFIFILLLMFSFSGVLYLMVRALPRMAELDAASVGADGTGGVGAAGSLDQRSLLDRWAHSQLPEKVDAVFNEWLLKSLRKFKVFTLKLDNAISKHLHKIRNEHAEADKKSAIDFKEMAESKKEE